MSTYTSARIPAHDGTAAPADKPKTGRLATASMVGTTLEWYDFTVYNTMAALIFNHLFFPSFDPLTGTILAFSTYAVGYISRPIGGVIFGHLGDRLGGPLAHVCNGGHLEPDFAGGAALCTRHRARWRVGRCGADFS